MSCTGCAKAEGGKPAGCKSNGYCSSSGCNKLDVFDWLAGVPLPDGRSPFDAVEVRFKNTRKNFYRNANALQLLPGDLVTVEASGGFDIGMVSLNGELVRAQMQRKGAGTDVYELRKVLHRSTQEEIDTWHRSRQLEDETMFAARAICREAKLDMKVTDVEYQGDGTKATFYYTAEQRLDLKDLLRRLADRFHVRIDMKQIGARQEAGRIGGIGSCGRELCCSTWLTDFRTVTTSAARYQQLALNPQKLAGQCGKLKCCLNYELDMYIESIKSYPSANAKLKTKQGTGMHMKTDIFGERMWYLFKKAGSSSAMAGFPIDVVRDILAKNKEGIEPEVDLHMVDEPVAVVAAPIKSVEYENVVGGEDLGRFDHKVKSGKKHGRGGKGRGGAHAKGAESRGTGPAQDRPGGPRPERRRQQNGPKPPREDQAGHATPPPHGDRPAGGEAAAGSGDRSGNGRNRDGRDRRRKGRRPGPPQGPKPTDA